MRPTPAQLRAARAWMGWSQDEAAQAAGLNASTILRVEAGQHVQLHSVEALVAAFKAYGLVFSGRNLVHRLTPEERVF